jgi:LGFP repeat
MPLPIAIKTSSVLVNKPIRSMFDIFDAHHAQLKHAPGRRISGLESVPGGSRVRYENGTIYARPDRMVWVHGAIGERYEQLGGPTSWLGLPLSEELSMPEGGRATVFDRGTVYWWPDVGAIDLNEVVVQYTGLMCFGETDSDGGSDSDEPYVALGVTTASGGAEVRSRIYEDIDGGESQPDLIEIYRGLPQGISITTLLMEHDDGDPDKYRAVIAKAVDKGMEKLAPKIAEASVGIPVFGPVIAVAVAEGLPLLAPVISDLLNELLGTDDDTLGNHVLTLSAKQMVVLSARAVAGDVKGVSFKVETPLLAAQGASYKVYFSLVAA